MSKHLDDVETKINTLCENDNIGIPNMPNFYIWNNQHVSVHHHYAKEADHETTEPELVE